MVYGGHFKVFYMSPQSVKKLKVKPKETWPERRNRIMRHVRSFFLKLPLEMEMALSFFYCPVLTKLSGGEDYKI